MTVRDDLAAEPDRTKWAGIRAAAIAALPRAARATTRNGKRIAITSGPTREGNAVVLTVRITENGVDITPPALNPVRIVNPPVLVPDPLGPVVVQETVMDRATGEQTVVTRQYREDPAAALRSIVADLLR